MAGEAANVEIALAKSLVKRMDEGDVRRTWSKVLNHQSVQLATRLPLNPPTRIVKRHRRDLVGTGSIGSLF